MSNCDCKNDDLVKRNCEHKNFLEYHPCCNVIICKNCGESWGEKKWTPIKTETTPYYVGKYDNDAGISNVCSHT